MKRFISLFLVCIFIVALTVSSNATIYSYDQYYKTYIDVDGNEIDYNAYCLITATNHTVASGFGEACYESGEPIPENSIELLPPGWYEAIWVDTALDTMDLSDVRGKIGLVLRGGALSFDQKVARIKEAGGIAAIVGNNYTAQNSEGVNELENVDIISHQLINQGYTIVGMVETGPLIPNISLTSDITTELICEATSKSYDEVIPAMLDVAKGYSNSTGLLPTNSVKIFIGRLSDYNASIVTSIPEKGISAPPVLNKQETQSINMSFTDVPEYAWYYSDVKKAVETELVNGKTASTYCPDDYLTYAEAVKLAACMNQKYLTGSISLANGTPWYQSYVDYAFANGIIINNYNWDTNATRAGYMAIFAYALPENALMPINDIPDGSIPDIPMTHPQATEIYKLYRAGILQGSDAQHNCNPYDPIRRSEVAAILTRMMYAEKRVLFSINY